MTEPNHPYGQEPYHHYDPYQHSVPQGGHYPPGVHQQQQKNSKNFGIAALVLGIIALLISSIPLIGLLSVILGIAAIVFGTLSVQKKSGRGLGIAGIITGVIGGFVTIVLHILIFLLAASAEVDMEYYPSYQDEFVQQVSHLKNVS